MRGFRRNPGFAITAIGSLALGIGAVVTIFTAADSLLFRPLPYRLAMIWERNTRAGRAPWNVISPANFVDWKTRNSVLEDMAAFLEFPTTLLDGDRSEEFHTQSVSANLFPMLGVQPVLGRSFTAEEDLASSRQESLLLISNRLWQSRFGGDPKILGRRVMINSVPRTIIGVMPPGFYFLHRNVDLWGPLGLDPAFDYRKNSGRYMNAVGRLKPGVTIAHAQTQMKGSRRWHMPPPVAVLPQPAGSAGMFGHFALMIHALVPGPRSSFYRTSGKRSPVHALCLFRQTLTESLLLAALAGMSGLMLGKLALAGLVALAPQSLTQSAPIAMDWRIILFAVGLSTLTGILFGFAPSIMASRADVAPEPNRTSRWSSGHGTCSRAWLIVGEIAAAVILLAGASLLIRSLVKLQGADPGLKAANLLTFRFNLPAARYSAAQRTQFFNKVISRIEQLPGVRSASAVSYLPFNGMAAGTSVAVGGRPPARPGEHLVATIRTVMPRYFETMGIPIRHGRDFTDQDNTPESPIRFIVNEAFVRKYLPGEEPLGKTSNAAMGQTNPFGEVVGVVGDVKEGTLAKDPEPTVYYNHAHLEYTGMTTVVRTQGDPLALAGPLCSVMRGLDATLPVADMNTMETILGETYARERFSAILLTGFSFSALLLAAIGIYGVMAYSVSERTREIGVRVAMGADTARIVTMVLGDAARFIAAGLLAGVAGALAASRFVSGLLFQTGERDPVAFTIAIAFLIAAASVAAHVPDRRAARLDPMQALCVE
jgi:putative ABC transport system permease protein